MSEDIKNIENDAKDKIKAEISNKLKAGMKLSNKMFVLLFLLSPLIFVFLVVLIPFFTLGFLIYSYWEFKKSFRIIKQKHERALKF
jgi:flagellar basal body-associated protein FliL